MCYFVDGRQELVHLPIRTILRELALQEGLRPNYIMTSDGRRSSYTAPKTYGPHLTFGHIKCRRPIGKDVVYGLLTWRYLISTSLPMVLIQIRATFTWATLNLFWCTKPTPRETQAERSYARTLQLRTQNASPHQTQPKTHKSWQNYLSPGET